MNVFSLLRFLIVGGGSGSGGGGGDGSGTFVLSSKCFRFGLVCCSSSHCQQNGYVLWTDTHTPGQSQTIRSHTQAANRHRKIVQSLKIPVGRIQYLECEFNVRSVRYFEFIFETFRSNTEPKAHFMQANQNRKTSCRMGRFQILKLYIFDKCVHHCTFV